MCRRCGTASRLRVYGWVLCACRYYDNVLGYGGVVHTMYGRKLLCRDCRGARRVHLHSWLLLSGGSGYELCGDGGVMHHLHGRQLLRRGCRRARCMHVHSWLLLPGGNCYELCGYGGILHNLYCRQLLRGCCHGARCMHLYSRLLFSCGSRYELCGHGGVLHNLHCWQLLLRICLGARCVHLQFRIFLVSRGSYSVCRNSSKLRCVWCWQLLCRRRRRASGMHVYGGVCFYLNDIERLHDNYRDLRDVHSRELVCWRCRATGGLYLHSWILLSRGSRYELCGYGGVMHSLHCRKLLCRRCRGARCMHLQFRILLWCWCSHAGIFFDSHDIERVRGVVSDLFGVPRGQQVYRRFFAAGSMQLQSWVLLASGRHNCVQWYDCIVHVVWRRFLVCWPVRGAGGVYLLRWVLFGGHELNDLRRDDAHVLVVGLRRGQLLCGRLGAGGPVLLQRGLRVIVVDDNRVYGDRWHVHRMRCRVQLQRWWHPRGSMHMREWLCFDIRNIGRVHNNDRDVFDVPGGLPVYWCGCAAGTLHLRRWVVCPRWRHRYVHKSWRVVHSLHPRQLVRGWVRATRPVRDRRVLLPGRVGGRERVRMRCGLLRHCCGRFELRHRDLRGALHRDRWKQLPYCVHCVDGESVPGRLLLHWRWRGASSLQLRCGHLLSNGRVGSVGDSGTRACRAARARLCEKEVRWTRTPLRAVPSRVLLHGRYCSAHRYGRAAVG